MKRSLSAILCFALMLSLTALAAPAAAEGNALPTVGERLSTNKTEYIEGEPILVTAYGEGKDWIGLYLENDVGDGGIASIYWYYVADEGHASGDTVSMIEADHFNAARADCAGIPAGRYRVGLYADDGYRELEKVVITVKPDPNAPAAPPAAPSAASLAVKSDKPGRADGTLTVLSTADGEQPERFAVVWANASGELAGYTPIAVFDRKGTSTEYALPDHLMIPAGADRMLVYGLDHAGTRSDTAASVTLPAALTLGKPLYELEIMSDIHLQADPNHLYDRHFAAALEDIKRNAPESIGIFINGDIADHGQPAEYDTYRALVAAAGDTLPPVHAAIGNHDIWNGVTADAQIRIFLDGTGNDSTLVYFDRWISGVHFIFLGSEKTTLYAELSDMQLRWLDKKLAEDRDPNRPTFVFLHQGLMNTVAGCMDYQDWHGVTQSTRLSNILKKYPEVVLSSGHSHWTLESAKTIKPFDDKLPTIINTASCAYLWDDGCIATNVGITGSEGWYVRVYDDVMVFSGRDFANGLWIGSAQFVMDLYRETPEETDTETDTAPESEPDTEPATEPVTQPDTAPDTLPETQPATDAPTEAPGTAPADPASSEDASDERDHDADNGGCGSALTTGGPIAVMAAAAAALFRRRKEN